MASYKESFDDITEELLDLSSSILQNFTTYRNEDPLVILHKLIAALSVSSNEYINKYINSKFLQPPDVMDTRSRYLLLQTFDMIPNKVIPGTIDVIFEYTGDALGQEIVIPEGTEFLVGNNEIPFTTIDDHYIKAYNTYSIIKIIEGEYVTEIFSILNFIGNFIELESDSVATDYVKVYVDGVSYKKVDYAQYSSEINVFSIEYDINHHYNIVMSDEAKANITETSEIIVDYIQSTGDNDFNPYEDTIIIDSEVLINEETDDEEDISEEIRVSSIIGYTVGDTSHTEENNYEDLSAVMSTFRQSITVEDYTSLVNYYPGVAVSAAYDVYSKSATIPELNIYSPFLLKIVVAPTDGYYITDQLRENLLEYLRNVGLGKPELAIAILDPEYVEVNISIGVVTTTNNQSELLDIYSTINNTINDYFKVGNIKFGSYIDKDYISSIVAKSDNRIEYVDVLEFSDNNNTRFYLGYQLNAVQLPLLDNLEIIFDYRNISLSDNINFFDKITNRDITYYLQGSRGETLRVQDISQGEIHQVPVDDIYFEEDKYFGYNVEFDANFNQNTVFNTMDHFKGHGYNARSVTRLYTDYTNDYFNTDNSEGQDDFPRTNNHAIVTDRLRSYDITYNY